MIQLVEHKEYSEHKSIAVAPLPAKVHIPVIQHFGKPCDRLLVAVNDDVQTGQMIATSGGGLFSPVHASVSGRVTAIGSWPHPLLGKAQTITITSDGKDAKAYHGERSDADAARLSKDDIRKIIFDAGIVGLGGAGFPTHIKLTPPKPIETFILNGVECEPYLTTDFRLMVERSDALIKGITIALQVLEPKQVIIAIEDNKREAVEIFKQAVPSQWRVRVLKTRYPQGGEKQVIKSCLNKEVPQGKLPFDIGVVVQNVATVFAIYEAVYTYKPLYEKVITVAGKYLAHSGNYTVRLGTPMKEVLEQYGPSEKKPAKIVMGGPMMGIAQANLDVPVVKGTSGIIVLPAEELREMQEQTCLRCGDCIAHCPMGLLPSLMSQAIAKDRFDLAQEYGLMDCIECGLCSYLCPANRNIVQAIKYAKQRVRAQQQKKK